MAGRAIDDFEATAILIRIDISSSDFPQYSVHSNYPGVWSKQTKTRIATQTVHTGKKYPSKVMIPIL